MANPSASPGPGNQPRGLFRTLGDDVQTVVGDMQRSGVRRTFSQTFADLEAFYLTNERKERLQTMGRARRTIYLGAWLLHAMFLKLTPARRVADYPIPLTRPSGCHKTAHLHSQP